jgi:hypothetical protein
MKYECTLCGDQFSSEDSCEAHVSGKQDEKHTNRHGKNTKIKEVSEGPKTGGGTEVVSSKDEVPDDHEDDDTLYIVLGSSGTDDEGAGATGDEAEAPPSFSGGSETQIGEKGGRELSPGEIQRQMAVMETLRQLDGSDDGGDEGGETPGGNRERAYKKAAERGADIESIALTAGIEKMEESDISLGTALTAGLALFGASELTGTTNLLTDDSSGERRTK